MARFTALFERSFVRVAMAGRASVKLHVLIASGPSRLVRLVAFLASHLAVQPGERVPCFRVVKLRGLLPVIHVMTALAVVSKLSLVRIGVAGQAIRRQPKK
jgi:hypothetical protein